MAAPSHSHYDTVIIGAGMSGLAAGIRLALAGKRAVILEQHYAPGGLNGFYAIHGRKFDVGLHAVTNFTGPQDKHAPLSKLLRQLRIPREEWHLRPQNASCVCFPGETLRFGNGIELLESEVARAFPKRIDAFRKLHADLMAWNDADLSHAERPACAAIEERLGDPVLSDMLLCPLFYYGSARENDIDFNQLATLWKALYAEGFARPPEGVRTLIHSLLDKYRALGGERRMHCKVEKLVCAGNRVQKIILADGTELTADHVLSSAGLPETLALCGQTPPPETLSTLAYAETISVLNRKPAELGWDSTICFFNRAERFFYGRPDALVDEHSGVICFPNNYRYEPGDAAPQEGFLRITALANYERWKVLDEAGYLAGKQESFMRLQHSAARFLGEGALQKIAAHTICTDMFTPLTVERFTGHTHGAVYGSPVKSREGRTSFENLYLCGTDQGFLGIVGALLSGISIANRYLVLPSGS